MESFVIKLITKSSIISDYIGRPVKAYSEKGDVVCETDYDIYGGLRNLKGEKKNLRM